MPTNKYIQLSLTYRYQLIRCINVILSYNCVILITNKGLRGSKKTSVLFSHGLNKACLIPDSYRATERNGNSISVDFTEYSIENDENDGSVNIITKCHKSCQYQKNDYIKD
jgi:hypothetical protein